MKSKRLELNENLINLLPFGLNKNDALKVELQKKGLVPYDFTLGDPKEPTPEFIRQALIQGLTNVSQYPLTNGSESLKIAAKNWVKRRFSVDLDHKTQVISTNGSKEGIFHIPQVLFDPTSTRKTIVFPEPGYPVYKSGTILAGGVPLELPLDPNNQYVFRPQDIPSHEIKNIRALWISYPHNPTGAQISSEEILNIYNWAQANNIVILSDECYVDMFFEGGTPPPSFLSCSANNHFKNVLCFFSLSKRSGMTGYRSGFIAGDSEILSYFAKYRLNAGLGTPDFVQSAAIAAWNDDTHVLERNKIFAEKRRIAEAFLTRNHFNFLKSSSTFYLWIQIPKKYSCATDFCAALAQTTGILATPGEAFGPHCSNYFRLALVPTPADLTTSLNLFQAKIDSGEFIL